MHVHLVLLKMIGKGVANAFGGGIAGDLLFEALPEIAADVWKWWAAQRSPEQRRADLAALAHASPDEVHQEVAAIVKEEAADKPAATQKALTLYLSLIPGQVRRSLRRPNDPTGTTVAFEQVPRQADDLIPFLPAKLPRFKPGDRPLLGVDWELDELLGVGGFGEVWRARNPLLDGVPPVALKFCLDQHMAQYLRNEAAVLNRVMRQGRHPGIVTLERTYLSAETPCLEYEFVVGGDLAALIQAWHRSDPKPTALEISRVFHQLAEVAGFAHAQTPPIVHRDLKPANILRQIGPDGTSRLKIADFGIGGVATRQAISEQTRGTTRGLFLSSALRGSCTPLYASPQQMRGDAPDPRDDVFALGVIWYQMLTGDLTAGRPGGRRWQLRLAEMGLDGKLIDLMGECFEDSLEDRIPCAATLARRLAELLPAEAAKPAPARLEADPLRTVPHTPAARPAAEAVRRARTEEIEEKEQKRLRELERALAEVDAAVRASPEDAPALARRGELHRLLGKQDQAISDCTEAIRLDMNQSEAYSTRGGAYRLKGQFDLAIADCTQAVGLDPRNVLAWYHRGESHRMKGQLDRAISDLGEAIRLDPAYSWAYGSRGAAYRQKGDYARAVADLDENLRLDPAYAWAWAVRGETHRLRGDFDQAIADCNEALRLLPRMALAYATRGAAFRQKGDFATAQADLREALRLQPGNPFARDQMELARRRTK
jgi:tetratricopeptide (TPR) repeat protein